MMTLFFASLATFIVAILITVSLIKYANKLKLMDYPNKRSYHKLPTPLGGGFAVVFSLFVGLSIISPEFLLQNKFFLIAFFIIISIGIIDDILATRPLVKFICVATASTIIFFDGFSINSLGTWFGYSVPLGYFALPVTIFSVVGFTNSINLVDGLDGLATTISILILSFFAVIGYQFKDAFIFHFSILSISSLLGFLVFNRSPAKIFLGDIGALAVGFTISIIAISSIRYINTTSVLLLCFIPILDTLVVMIRRIINGLSPFQADKTHLHHLIVRQKRGNVRKSVRIMMLLQLTYSLIGYSLANADAIIAFVIFATSTYIFYEMFTLRHNSKRNV